MRYLQSVPTSKYSKSVAADPISNRIFVALTDAPGPDIAVYGY